MSVLWKNLLPEANMRRLFTGSIAALVLLTATVFAQAPPTARTPPPGPPKPAPRHADGTIDFTGLWRPADIFLIEDIALGLKPGATIPLNAWAREIGRAH